MAGKGISGLAVAFAAGGGLLVYAGFRGVNPLQALKDVSTGKPLSIPDQHATVTVPDSEIDLGVGTIEKVGNPAAITAAAGPYMKDKYSQARRRQVGYSDCSSFVYKIMRDIGKPPTVAWSNTANYHVDPRLKTIPTAQAQPGDLALSSGHVMILTSSGGANADAIGQQNPTENVVTGTLAKYMPKPYVIKRWMG